MNYYAAGKTKVFISYSKSDIQYKDTLLKQLRLLEQEISVWHDRLIPAGSKWDESVKGALNEADIILFLVSANSLATDYILDIELPIAQRRVAAGSCQFVPIILKPCLWEIHPIGAYNSLPSKGIPITSSKWNTEDDAWLEVVKGIHQLLP